MNRSFLVRLNHLIIIQSLFVFAALALIIFFPSSELGPQVDLRKEKQQISQLVEQIEAIESEHDSELLHLTTAHEHLDRLFERQERILQASILVIDSSRPGNYRDYYRYVRDDEANQSSEPDFAVAFDNEITRDELQMPDNVLMPVFYSNNEALLRYNFHLDDNTPAMLVVAAEHNLVIAPRSDLVYTITLLFLFTTLVSLMTIYLISRRFQQPLRHLLRGLEKTAEGEMFYMVEAEGDAEISKLANSFNRMAGTLLENSQQINRYNRRLKSTNRRLVQSRHFLSSLIDVSPFGIITASPEGEIMTFNKRAIKDFGVTPEEAIGGSIDQLFCQPLSEQLASGEIGQEGASFEVLCLRPDQSRFPAYLKVQPIFSSQGNQNIVPAYLLIVHDISESKSFQEMMVRLDRYYTRGEMAGDIAHEINNFLAILSGNVELMPLMMRRGDTEKISKKLELMRTTVERIARFTDGLMDANMGEVSFELIDLNQLVENIYAFLKPQNRFDHVEIERELSTTLPPVEVDIGQIQQLFVNLLHNAADALEGAEPPCEIRVRTQKAADSDHVEIIIEDNGPGVAADKVDNLFVKRFTTKKKGHGIGLITCRRIVDSHNGGIGYEFDNGARFVVNIPIRHHDTVRLEEKTEQPQEEVSTPAR